MWKGSLLERDPRLLTPAPEVPPLEGYLGGIVGGESTRSSRLLYFAYSTTIAFGARALRATTLRDGDAYGRSAITRWGRTAE